jgi:hypothetical protein
MVLFSHVIRYNAFILTTSIMKPSEFTVFLIHLPWYKRLFFPQLLWDFSFEGRYVGEREILEIYKATIYYSWLKSFYDWLFPELFEFVQEVSKTLDSKKGITRQETKNKERALINIFKSIVIMNFTIQPDDLFFHSAAHSIHVVSTGFVEMIENDNFIGSSIEKLLCSSNPFRALINAEACNEALIVLAKKYQNYPFESRDPFGPYSLTKVVAQFKLILKDEDLSRRISLKTVFQALHMLFIPLNCPCDLISELLNFKDENNEKLSRDDIELLYLQAIRAGCIEALAYFDDKLIPFDDKRMIDALKDAAQNEHFEMVFRLMNRISSKNRLEVFQTYSSVKKPWPYRNNEQNILQYSVCHKNTKFTQRILYALDSKDDRMALVTSVKEKHELSALNLAAEMHRTSHLKVMLDALSKEQAIEAIMPRKIDIDTPLYLSNYNKLYEYEEPVMPILLERLFGNNQKLYAAFEYLVNSKISRRKISAWRDNYLANHFPSAYNNAMRFFSFSNAIPGHPLNKEELDLVIQVALYRYYGIFDSVQRSGVEERMEPSSTNFAYKA